MTTLNQDTAVDGNTPSPPPDPDPEFTAALKAAFDDEMPVPGIPVRNIPAQLITGSSDDMPRDVAVSIVKFFNFDPTEDSKNVVDFVLGNFPAAAFTKINARLLMQIGFDILRENKRAVASAAEMVDNKKEFSNVRLAAGKNIVLAGEMFAKVAVTLQGLAQDAVDKMGNAPPPSSLVPRNLPPMLFSGGNVQINMPPASPEQSPKATIDSTPVR